MLIRGGEVNQSLVELPAAIVVIQPQIFQHFVAVVKVSLVEQLDIFDVTLVKLCGIRRARSAPEVRGFEIDQLKSEAVPLYVSLGHRDQVLLLKRELETFFEQFRKLNSSLGRR